MTRDDFFCKGQPKHATRFGNWLQLYFQDPLAWDFLLYDCGMLIKKIEKEGNYTVDKSSIELARFEDGIGYRFNGVKK